MSADSGRLIDVFPITTAAFGLRADWFEAFAPKLIRPSYLLFILLLVLGVGIMTLRRFEHADWEKKLWNVPVVLTAIFLWPGLVLGIKDLVDTFNTFLIVDVFQIPWKGFGFPEIGSIVGFIGWSAEGLTRLLPNLAYWTIYAFFIIFFFFFAVLGPFVLAKGVLFDEIEALLELLKEMTNLLFWQTTLVILVAFIMPDIVSGKPYPPHPQANFYFLSLILGVMIFFVPSLTRKFANHLGSSFIPLGFKWGGALMAISGIGRFTGLALNTTGIARVGGPEWEIWEHRISAAEEFHRRYEHVKHIQDLHAETKELHHKLREAQAQEEHRAYEDDHESPDPLTQKQNDDHLIALSKKANHEMNGSGDEGVEH